MMLLALFSTLISFSQQKPYCKFPNDISRKVQIECSEARTEEECIKIKTHRFGKEEQTACTWMDPERIKKEKKMEARSLKDFSERKPPDFVELQRIDAHDKIKPLKLVQPKKPKLIEKPKKITFVEKAVKEIQTTHQCPQTRGDIEQLKKEIESGIKKGLHLKPKSDAYAGKTFHMCFYNQTAGWFSQKGKFIQATALSRQRTEGDSLDCEKQIFDPNTGFWIQKERICNQGPSWRFNALGIGKGYTSDTVLVPLNDGMWAFGLITYRNAYFAWGLMFVP